MPAWAPPDRTVTAATWPGRLVLDGSTRLLDGGQVIVGGSPLRILRLTASGAAELRRLVDGTDPDGPVTASGSKLASLLVDRGIAHPAPRVGPYTEADVTVVVPVYRAARPLARTLAAIWATAPSINGVIVVDDASPDADTVRRVVAGWARTRLVRHDTNRGPGAARNTGLAEVHGPLVAFIDAGCEPTPGWLGPLLAHFADDRVAVVAPRITSTPRGLAVGDRPGPRSHREPDPRGAVLRYQDVRSSLDLGPESAGVRARTRVSYVPAACLVARRRAALSRRVRR